MDWPNIRKCSSLKEKKMKKVLKGKFEDGYVQSRPLWTRSKKKFEISWNERNALPNSEKVLLENFIDANMGNTFTWNDPLTCVTEDYTVLFEKDEIEFIPVCVGFWMTTVNLEEQ